VPISKRVILNFIITKITKSLLSNTGRLKTSHRKKENVVYLLSTAHANTVDNSGKLDKDGNAVKTPSCILQYNNSSGGVDGPTARLPPFAKEKL